MRSQSSTTTPAPQAPELAGRLGLRRAGGSWRGTCPCCGYGSDAFGLTQRGAHVVASCWSCGDSAAIARLLRAEGVPHAPPPPDLARAERQAERQARAQERAAGLWAGADPAAGTPVETYLRSRHLPDLAHSPALRWRRDTPHPGGGRLPAMLGLVSAPDGKPVALHRTFLKRDGSGKADATPTKASIGRIFGGAIRLAEAGPALVVGEGIETSAAAGVLAGLPSWAAVNAGNMGRAMVLPPEVREVIVAVDNDPPGRRAAAEAGARWRGEGRRVRYLIPRAEGADAADILAEVTP